MRAWVLGGTGAVGSAVVRLLTERGLDCCFTWHTNAASARELHESTGARALAFDARGEVAGWVTETAAAHGLPNVLVYAVARNENARLADLERAEWDAALQVNVTAPFLVLRAVATLIERAPAREPLDVVLLGALDRGQSLPLPVHFAATQGALSALTMAAARDLGPLGVRVNQLALGVLERGLSRTLEPAHVEQFLKFSALRRRGTPEEVARAVAWLALENTYMTGRVIPVNGGI